MGVSESSFPTRKHFPFRRRSFRDMHHLMAPSRVPRSFLSGPIPGSRVLMGPKICSPRLGITYNYIQPWCAPEHAHHQTGPIEDTAHIRVRDLVHRLAFVRTFRQSLGFPCHIPYAVQFDIGDLEGSPLFHSDENIFVCFDKVRVWRTFVFSAFREHVRQICSARPRRYMKQYQVSRR